MATLYRKYRPQTFSDVVGQEHITKTLSREVETGKIGHAYLFCGTRGTGKTSIAKILARAINCENPQAGNPCNECAVCKGILDGSIIDIAEIDAASNNGVDYVRALRGDVAIAPMRAKYRVFIIDEVHMMTPAAFNALLKTLEEPPEHIVFILATTEINKVLPTIQSRCQRFDFKRISSQTIAARLLYVAQQEGFALEESAAEFLGMLADGAMRDGLSLLESVKDAAGGGAITEKIVRETLGIASAEKYFELASAVAKKDTAATLLAFNSVLADSEDSEAVVVQFLSHLRDLAVCQNLENPAEIIDKPAEIIDKLRKQAAEFSKPQLIAAMKELCNILNFAKTAGMARNVVESGLIIITEG